MEIVLNRTDGPRSNTSNVSSATFRSGSRFIPPFSSPSDLMEIARSGSGACVDQTDRYLLEALREILNGRALLTAVFQPIIDLGKGGVFAYEGLIRGPKDHPLHLPYNLFDTARKCNLIPEVEKLCRQVVISSFSELELPGKLFLNISPERLLDSPCDLDARLKYLEEIGLDPGRIVLELTENQATLDYDRMREAVEGCRKLGFQIAIDDLGEGFSSLRLWSEIRPDYVKIDMHFIQGIERDPVKQQFVQSIQLIAGKSGTTTIAEGIETEDEFLLLRELGVACGQGYFIERPNPHPNGLVLPALSECLKRNAASAYSGIARRSNLSTALKLLRIVPVVTPEKRTNEIFEIFASDPSVQIIAVVEQGIPIGTINRLNMVDRFARPYQRELFGKQPCSMFMTPKPLVFDKNTSLQELSLAIVDADPHHLSNGCAITDQGQYIGMGSGHDIMREITQMQISAARYANPLTQLPGNVPINEEIDRLISSGHEFVACYCDIDHFKPFNDVYGYRRGDDVIQLTGDILSAHCAINHDFLGHIGGDDFMVLFLSEDWEARCEKILARFSEATSAYYTDKDRGMNGYISEDRQGREVLHPLLSLSMGAVKIMAGHHYSNYQVAAAATEAKKQAKATSGNSIFFERRKKL